MVEDATTATRVDNARTPLGNASYGAPTLISAGELHEAQKLQTHQNLPSVHAETPYGTSVAADTTMHGETPYGTSVAADTTMHGETPYGTSVAADTTMHGETPYGTAVAADTTMHGETPFGTSAPLGSTIASIANPAAGTHLHTPYGQHEPGKAIKARHFVEAVEGVDGIHGVDGERLAHSRSSTPTCEPEQDVQESSAHSLAETSIC